MTWYGMTQANEPASGHAHPLVDTIDDDTSEVLLVCYHCNTYWPTGHIETQSDGHPVSMTQALTGADAPYDMGAVPYQLQAIIDAVEEGYRRGSPYSLTRLATVLNTPKTTLHYRLAQALHTGQVVAHRLKANRVVYLPGDSVVIAGGD